jgi:TonB family protein
MLAYVLLVSAATVGQDFDEEPLVNEPANLPAEVYRGVTCWDGSRASTIPECPPLRSVDKTASAKPRNSPASWVTMLDYPVEALVAVQEGSSDFRLTIGPDGRSTACDIVRTSRSTLLDDAACQNAMRRARFLPALDRDGNPTVGSYQSRVTWRVPGGESTVTKTIEDHSLPRSPRLAISAGSIVAVSDYPETALAERRSGQSMVAVKVSELGLPTGCEITTGSGSSDLDLKACAISMRWKYQPALDFNGNPSPGIAAHVIIWRLPITKSDSAEKDGRR